MSASTIILIGVSVIALVYSILSLLAAQRQAAKSKAWWDAYLRRRGLTDSNPAWAATKRIQG